MQIQISWLLQKPTDLDLLCLQRQGISGFSRIRVKNIFSSWRQNISSSTQWSYPVSTIKILWCKNKKKYFLHTSFIYTMRFLINTHETSLSHDGFIKSDLENNKRTKIALFSSPIIRQVSSQLAFWFKRRSSIQIFKMVAI